MKVKTKKIKQIKENNYVLFEIAKAIQLAFLIDFVPP